jgi:hypothetical protein
MATPNYAAILAKVRDWANKPEANTITDSVIASCLSYAADECYRKLRIPPLEATVFYGVTESENTDKQFTTFIIPNDLTQFTYLKNEYTVFNEVADSRTFFDKYSEKYPGPIWMWKEDKLYIHPQQSVGSTIDISYYKRLPALDATYAVVPENYDLDIGLDAASQPYLALEATGGIPLFFAGAGENKQVFNNYTDATIYGLTQPITAVTTLYFSGYESPNWLKDENERLLLWGALYHLGAFLFDDKMEQRYQARFNEGVQSLNKEEQFRRASGGNVRMNFNGGGLI